MPETHQIQCCGTIRICNITLECVVLTDGTRGFLFKDVKNIHESFGYSDADRAMFLNFLFSASDSSAVPVFDGSPIIYWDVFCKLIELLSYNSRLPFNLIRKGNFYIFNAIKIEIDNIEKNNCIRQKVPIYDLFDVKQKKYNKQKKSFVYFVSCLDLVKIGYSCNIEDRMSALQTGAPAPLKLLGKIPGGSDKEKELHRKFSKYRLGGEWFTIEGDLENYLSRFSLYPREA